jgi:hypothetical protein
MNSSRPLRYLSLVLGVLLLSSNLAVLSLAEPGPPIHRTVDSEGVQEYFAHPKLQAEPAQELPALHRERSIASSRQGILVPQTCRRHGGVKCSVGADSDGSVICYDGFRDSAQPYSDNCLSARLILTELRHIEGLKYAVAVRNTAGVPANGVSFSYRPPVGLAVVLPLMSGPETVSPYGSAEFVVSSFKKPFETEPAQLDQKYLWITCGNCG